MKPDCLCPVCRDYGDQEALDAVDRNLVAHVTGHGWGVLSIPEDDTSAGWSFTVGLWHAFRVPEVALFGLAPEVAQPVLNSVGERVRAGRGPAATRGVRFLQCLWPDGSGRFPGEDWFAEDLAERQPHLWLERTRHPEGPWTDPAA